MALKYEFHIPSAMYMAMTAMMGVAKGSAIWKKKSRLLHPSISAASRSSSGSELRK